MHISSFIITLYISLKYKMLSKGSTCIFCIDIFILVIVFSFLFKLASFSLFICCNLFLSLMKVSKNISIDSSGTILFNIKLIFFFFFGLFALFFMFIGFLSILLEKFKFNLMSLIKDLNSFDSILSILNSISCLSLVTM